MIPSSARDIVWDLSDLYKSVSDPCIEGDLTACEIRAAAFARLYRPMFAESGALTANTLHTALVEYEQICEMLSKLGSFSGLLSAADTGRPEYQQLDDRVSQKSVEIGNLLTFFDLGWLSVPDEDADKLIADPALANFAHYLASSRRYKPHTKTEPEELILNQKSLTARGAWTDLFDTFVGSLQYTLEYKGEKQSLTQAQILSKLYEPDRDLRRTAATSFYNQISQHSVVLTSIVNCVAQDHSINDSIRGYSGPMESRHLVNEIDPEVVTRMLDVTESNYPIAHQYYRTKARLVGLPKLANYDLYAPVSAEMPTCLYQTGRDTVLAAFDRFHPQMKQIASEFFEKNWIDAETRPGKRGGAFSASTVPSAHPYILLNWTDKIRDVSTLAHELGHGIHQYLSRKQTYFNFHHPLTIAETASVFAEFLTFDYVMEQTADPEVQLGLLCSKIDDAFATVFRQTVLTRFEQAVHNARREQKLSDEHLCSFWWDANARLYGDSVEMLDLYKWGWSYIPHFIHTPFYCYAYVFGELLVLSLYQMYRERGAAFVPGYLELLESGSTLAPDALLARVGADIRDPGFWQKGFDVLKTMVARAEELANSVGR